MEQLEFPWKQINAILGAEISETIIFESNACSDAIALAYWPEQIIINGTFLICTQQILPDIPNLSPNPGCFIISTEYLSLVEITSSGIRSKFALSRITRILEKLGFWIFTINRFWNKYKSYPFRSKYADFLDFICQWKVTVCIDSVPWQWGNKYSI